MGTLPQGLRARALVIVTALTTLASCDRAAPTSVPKSTSSVVEPGPTAAIAPSAEPVPEPNSLVSEEPLVALPVDGFGDAVVSLPVGTREKRPIVIAVHGNYDRPEWQCGVWRAIVRDRAFVLCPRGVARTDSPSPSDIRFTFANGVAMGMELDRGIAALRARWPDFAGEIRIYTGFSLGAITGVAWLVKEPLRAPIAVLTEGSHAQWTPGAIAAFAKHGGKRVLFACGQPGCVSAANAIATSMKKVGVDAKVVHGKGMGHGYDGAVASAIAGELGWLDDTFQ